MFDRLKAAIRFLRTPVDLNGKDGKELTVSVLLGRDDCSRMLQEFSENDLSNCESLILVWRKTNGEILVQSSDNLDDLSAVGLLTVAQTLAAGGGSDVNR